MLTINHIDELRPKVAHKEEIREGDMGNGYTSFCYMIAAEGTFDDVWSRECRGIVFDHAGKVAGRPLHKFFNVNEREETQVGKIDWSKVVRVMEKRDGSMIHTVRGEDDSVLLKSKKSFDSDVAKAAKAFVIDKFSQSDYDINGFLIKIVLEENATAIFEFTAPDARIVLYYSRPELRLLHIRDNVTGEYWPRKRLQTLAATYSVPVVDEVFDFWDYVEPDFGKVGGYTLDVEKILHAAETRENIEGWVIQFDDGEMVKLKTAWYLARHKAMTFLRERDIALMVLEEQLDDLKSLLVGEGVDIQEVLKIEQSVLDDVRGIERGVKSIAAAEDFKMPRKDFVFKHRATAGPYFGMLMALYSGKEPDYKDYFKDNIWKQKYTLRQLNLIPSVAEPE
jgi:putative RNA ligase